MGALDYSIQETTKRDTDAPKVQAPVEHERIEFVGSGFGFFKVWFVNILLTFLTLGFYSPWAKIRNRKYLFSSINFRGHSFDYHGAPKPILIGRAITFGLFLVYSAMSYWLPKSSPIAFTLMMAATPFLIVKSFKFNATNTTYQGIHFQFRGQIKEAYEIFGLYLGIPLMLQVLTSIFLMTLINNKIPEQTQNAGIITTTFMLVQMAAITYYYFISSKFLGAIFNYLYSNLYYGDAAIKLKKKNIDNTTFINNPYYTNLVKGVLIIGVGFGMAVSMTTALAVSISTVIAMVTIPFVIVVYAAMLYISARMPFLILSYAWDRFSGDESQGSGKTSMAWEEYLKFMLKNTLLTIITLGLYYPWGKCKIVKRNWNNRPLKFASLDEKAAKGKRLKVAPEPDPFDVDFEVGF